MADLSAEQKIDSLKPSGLYYLLTALLLACYKFTEIFPPGFEGNVVVSIIDAALVVAFWWYFRREIASLLSAVRIRLTMIGMIALAAFAGAMAVDALADVIERSAFGEDFYGLYEFEDTSKPLLWSVIFTCIFPAIFEEVAFRGFILSGLANLTTRSAAIYVSSFLFGIMHFSVLSMIWLVPLGIALAWLRFRFGTLWYGVVAHLFYNFFITLITFDIIPGLI